MAFVVFPLLLLWRSLFAGEAFFWGTPLLQFVPWQRMATGMWRTGHLPLWNPLVGCGAPLAANYQTAAFYPLNALYFLLPAEVALSWTTVLHLALAGWGMYRWGRTVGLDRFSAFIGALALEGSGFLVARVALFPSMGFTFPWLAVWLWRGEVLVQHRRLRDALWLGLSLGLGLLAGHAQTALYGGVLLAAYLVFRVAQGRSTPHATRSIQLAGLALLIGVGLASVQLLPTAELMVQSQRSGGIGYDFAMTYSLWPWRLITLLSPNFFGNPGRGDYWGYATYWEDAAYVGLLPLLFAIGAVLRRRRGRERTGHVWFWVTGAAVALLLALGKNTPVFPFLFRHVPGFNLFQAPTRWLAVTTVALAALAALGAQRWPMGRSGKRRGALGIVVGVALLIGGLAAPRVVPGIPATFGPATAWLGGMLAVAGALTLLWRDVTWWRAAVGVFIALDLLLFGWPLVPTVDRSLYHDVTSAAIVLEREHGPFPARVYWPTDPTHADREFDAEQRVKFGYLTFGDFGPRDGGYWWGMREALLPNVGMLDGVAAANNFDPLLVGRYADLLEAAVEAPSLLRVMGVTHVVSDEPWPEGKQIETPNPRSAIRNSQFAILYRLPDALGRAWIVPAARQVAPDEMLAALVDPAFDPAAEVLLEQAVSSDQHAAASIEYRVTLQDTPNRVTIRAALDAPGYLMLADTWYPGWQATVDGEPVEILRANHAFRAVWLEAGEHTVEMAYRPASVLVG
ncbi:MAG: YfhO family protein, partial [Chloroflexi bacterium]|nr:YfhO family protein [Chloroflexota bacterium]